MKRHLKSVFAALIIAVTIGAFSYYIQGHPEIINQLREVPPTTIAVLLALYAVSFIAYVIVTRVSLKMYDKFLSAQENLLFNAYSSLVNFFGPGQSGPIFRAAYLKKRHNLSVKKFMFATLFYFAFYTIVSVMFVVVGSRPWWQTTALVLAAVTASFVVIRWYRSRRNVVPTRGFNLKNLGLMLVATLLQVTALAIIYGIELQRAGAAVSVGEILSYTGITNLTLFVALTPGAIGIREAFLIFSQSLHGIDSSTIVAANIIDRSVYLLFLGLLFVLVIATHAKDKLRVAQPAGSKFDHKDA